MKTCTVTDCQRDIYAKSMCRQRYRNERRRMVGRNERTIATPCSQCGTIVQKVPDARYRPFCDLACRDLYSMEQGIGAWGRPAKPAAPKAVRDLRSPLRRALEDGDREGVIVAIKAHTEVRPNGCWEWQRSTKDCYPVVNVAGRTHQVHRLSLEAKHGAPLGKQAAHHICANSFCVNPGHLQPVTARENTAEMLARTYMESRIADLEAALAQHNPTHPLLHEIGLRAAS